MRRRLPALALLVSALLLGCSSSPPLEEGYVVGKEHKPAWEEEVEEVECLWYNDDWSCKVWTISTSVEHHSETYSFRLEADTIEEGEKKKRKEWVSVDEETYHDYAKGMHYPDPR